MHDLPTALLEKNFNLFPLNNTMLVEPPDFQCVQNLAVRAPAISNLSCFTTHSGIYDDLSREQILHSVFSGWKLTESLPPQNCFVIYLQKSAKYTFFLIETALKHLASNGFILLAGENRAGIKSWKKKLLNFGEVVHCENGRRSSIYKMIPSRHLSTVTKATPDDWLQWFSVNTPDGNSLKIATMPGVFSEGRLDKGTRVLLSALNDMPIQGDVLDFACGSGVIGCYLKHIHPAISLSLSDVSALAIQTARASLDINRLSGVLITSDGMKKIKTNFDYIISNPPFHHGVHTQYATSELFLRSCSNNLKQNGKLIIVANDFLRYSQIITSSFRTCRIIKSESGFNVYEACK